jgi:GNAT superfamily N-acetyltransferase
MIRQLVVHDAPFVQEVINQAAAAYAGHIPSDCYHVPYMTEDELDREMARITFYGWEEKNGLVGVAGLEPVSDVTLIRHAYVRPGWQRHGIGSALMAHLKGLTRTPRLLVGTWAGADWAIRFYESHGFNLLADKDRVLNTYWCLPPRQIETSVVLGLEMKAEVA